MKYKAYPEYKKARLTWLDSVPNKWKTTHVKRFTKFTTGWTPPTENADFFDGDHLWANISDLGRKFISSTSKTITDMGVKATRIKKSSKGSLLFSFKLSIGQVSIVEKEMYTNEAIATFEGSDELYIPYMYWAAPLFIPKNAEENIYGAKLLNQERIANAPFILPSYAEQLAIANFLDHETAKIDQLIAKQETLIELLNEKRQAVISHAVTKGLNPDVKMKDSGVEWLGEVPEHWGICAMKYLVDEKVAGPYGASLTKAMYTSSGYKVYGQQQVIADDFVIGDYFISEEKYQEMERYTIYPNDVLISVMGTIGKVAVVPESIDKGIINPRLVRYKFDIKNIYPHFVQQLIMSEKYQKRLKESSQGSTMEGLNMGILGNLPMVFPDKMEQINIIEYAKKISRKYKMAISAAQNFIQLSQERRSSLISAAVTGKIDVRDWKPKDNS